MNLATWLSIMMIAALLAYAVFLILRNPFVYPYHVTTFDVTGKRNVDIEEKVEEYLLDPQNIIILRRHMDVVRNWKEESEQKLGRCLLKRRRRKQYEATVDDKHAYKFITTRNRTRYRQRNYVRTPYKIEVQDAEIDVSLDWIEEKFSSLMDIGYEMTRKSYHAKNQRKLMTPSLRRQIMKRDNYTCQNCGKHMPDEVGLQIDHIVPIAKGGKTVPSNLQVLCSKCNGKKGSK